MSDRLSVDNYKIESEMWVDEAIWGHRLYDEQTPWLTFLEFLGIAQSELDSKQNDKTVECLKFCASNSSPEIKNFNSLKYRPYRRLYLRNILFNNPYLEAILIEMPDEDSRWARWCQYMKDSSGGIPNPDFTYLRSRFNSFKDFVEVVKFLQDSAVEGDSNKRWSSKFVFPYGPNCLFEDLRVKKESCSNDRRFFARTGELLYLMLCRSQFGSDILDHLRNLGLISNDKQSSQLSKWDRLAAILDNSDEERGISVSANSPYLPYRILPEYDRIAIDWMNIFECRIPDYDALPHIVTITGLHIIIYMLNRSKEVLGYKPEPSFVLEIISPQKNAIRDLAANSFLKNDDLSRQAVNSYIKREIENGISIGQLTPAQQLAKAKEIIKTKLHWKDLDEIESTDNLQKLIEIVCKQAEIRHLAHLGKFHRSWTKEIGLSSSRSSRRIRYAPTDQLLKTLVLATVPGHMEFQQFLEKLYVKYGFIIGDRQAREIINNGDADQELFSENAYRLELRLASLGLLKRLSDACAYVQNPFIGELSNG